MAGNVAASQQGDVREGSRRGSALIPQGAARHSPGWLRQRGRRERQAGLTGRERGEARGRVRQQRPAVAERRYYSRDCEDTEGGDTGKIWTWIEVGCGRGPGIKTCNKFDKMRHK